MSNMMYYCSDTYMGLPHQTWIITPVFMPSVINNMIVEPGGQPNKFNLSLALLE
jgi:hypothetical protein